MAAKMDTFATTPDDTKTASEWVKEARTLDGGGTATSSPAPEGRQADAFLERKIKVVSDSKK